MLRQIPIIVIFSLSMLSGCSGPFTVSGTVVDQDGNRIEGVSLHITGAVATRHEIDSYGGEKTTVLDNGQFSASCGFCSAVHLFFSKDGYYSQSLDLAFFERKRGLRIVMRKVEYPVDLRRYAARLEVGPTIDDQVLGFGESPPYERRQSEIIAASVIPTPPYVTLKPVTTTDGAIIAQSEEFRRVPAQVLLDFSTARGGVILFEPTTRNLRDGLKEMYVAPDIDYPASVALDSSSDHSFFYCKIAGQYCKGVVHAPRLSGSKGVLLVSSNIEIHLNPYYGDRSLDDPTPY